MKKTWVTIMGVTKRALLVGVALTFCLPIAAHALPQVDQESIDRDSVNYLDDSGNVVEACSTSPGVPSSTGGRVFVIGDSLTLGMVKLGGLLDKLGSAGYTVDPTYTSSGPSSAPRVSGPSVEATGGIGTVGTLPLLAEHPADVAAADKIVIGLGTNGESDFVTKIHNLVAAIRDPAGINNTKAQIYWTNTYFTPNATSSDVNASILAASAADKDNFKIIDLSAAVATQPNLAPNGGDGVHYSSTGYIDRSNFIVSQLGATTNITVSGGCSCGSNLVGSDNKQRIYFYLISKGLSPPQAAGVMGNMQGESGFEPRLVEYGFLNSRDEVSVAGQPSRLDDNVPPNRNKDGSPSDGSAADTVSGADGVPGYGLVQFTAPSYKQGLRDLAVQKSIIGGDLGLQLDFLWQILSAAPLKTSVLDPLMASTTTDEAADIFLTKFEKPGNIAGTRPIRQGYAASILIEMTTLTVPPPATEGSTCADGGANSPVTPIISGPTPDIPCAAGEDLGVADGYKSGVLTRIRLCNVQNVKVNSQISKNIDSLLTAAKAEGMDMTKSAEGYRTIDTQLAVWKQRCGASYPITSKYARPPCTGNPMARPGYSNHGMGFAIDFTCNGAGIGQAYAQAQQSECFRWLVSHANAYGMYEYGWDSARGTGNRVNEFYEGWHWSVDGN